MSDDNRSYRDLTREELHRLIWSAPVKKVAEQFGITDVALAKACRRQHIPLPGRGYWARKEAGQAVEPTPLPDYTPPALASVQRREDEYKQPKPPVPSAIYLVGHGPRREPRPIELQYVRVERYIGALEAKLEDRFHLLDVFIDLNWPRVNWWDQEEFPAFVRLYAAIQQGLLKAVFVDLECGDPRHWAPYDTIIPSLRRAGIRLYNARYDDEDALQHAVEQRYGSGSSQRLWNGPSDASDVVAFFPALASAIGLEALGEERRYDPRWDEIARVLRSLGDENPYASSRYPFLGESIERRLIEEKIQREENERERRRVAGEQTFRVELEGKPLLRDEHIWSGQPRTDEQLHWAEERLFKDFEFTRVIDGPVFSYERTVDGFRVFADPRLLGAIAFRVYPPLAHRRAGRRRPRPAYRSFKILDNWKNDIARKFSDMVSEEIEKLRAGV